MLHCSWTLLKKKEYKSDPRDLGRHSVVVNQLVALLFIINTDLIMQFTCNSTADDPTATVTEVFLVINGFSTI